MDVFLDDCYGLERLKPPISHILDIGANVGFFSAKALIVFPSAVLHAYEPIPNLEEYLKTQATHMHFEYFMEAVGFEDARVSLRPHEDIVSTRCVVDNQGIIPQVALRKAVERLGTEVVDLVKLDCEGAEWEMFKDEETWRRIRNLTMEYHLWPNHHHEEIRRTVEALGFKVKNQQRTHQEYGLLAAYRPGAKT
jgi:FkbM family methyltransferase